MKMDRMKVWEEYRGYPFVPAMQAKRREFLDRYKQREGCADCGYAEYPEALSLVGSIRPESIRSMFTDIVDWMLASEVVCANCHAVRMRRQ